MPARRSPSAPPLPFPTAPAHPRIRVGIGGWAFAPWRGPFYPSGLVQKRELEYASRRLTAIEINGTFYGAQTPATYARWRDETPPGFVFSLKAPRFLVQARELARGREGVERFVHGGIAELDDRLGPILWQFAPGKRFDPDDLAGFLDLLPRMLNGRALRHVLEVRHDSFLCEQYLALTRAHDVPTVFTDSPTYPSFADPGGDFRYARLMRSRSDVVTGYPGDELDAWASRARTWAAGGVPGDLPRIVPHDEAPTVARDVFVFFISAAKERNPAAALGLIERLDRG
ncbi:DUF72 domain-containing protein [Chiayiivirga flava]|uniref:Uncharacterized protein YecE (DUF72 family) n=1 Tax=Chiayiivirga flava TaxID=659595 RepID=A0A7W8D7Y1_9GAMM|nr:DUF72 domain-containing protein [Chiayiivirga flava]MBB5209530.1 uncharacterized protein YecE (DUF72 family) [Chiayiivirga flava]